MELLHYPIEKLKQELLNCVKAELGNEHFKLFFFGSRVKGNTNDRADIDVGFLGEKALDSFVKGKIKDNIYNIATLYKIDFVDFGRVDEEFKKLALKKTELIYE